MNAADFAPQIREILSTADLDSVSAKAVRKQLESKSGKDLSSIKDGLNQLIKDIYNEVISGPRDNSSHNDDGDTKPTNGSSNNHSTHATASLHDSPDVSSSAVKRKAAQIPTPRSSKKVKSEEVVDENDEGGLDDEEYARRLQAQEDSKGSWRVSTRSGGSGRSSAKSSKASKASKSEKSTKRKGGGGFNKPMILSEPLAEFIGQSRHSRPGVVKKLWEYIKEKGLQNPSKKTEILCDEVFQNIFKVPKMGSFEMNKLLTAHLKKADDVVGAEADEGDLVDDEDDEPSETTPKPAKRAKKTTPMNKGFNKLMVLSEALSEVMGGEKVLSRPDVVKRLWVYIKEKKLQDPSDGRNILFDDTLKAVFKVGKSTSFQINKLLTPHLKRAEDVVGGAEMVAAAMANGAASAELVNSSDDDDSESPDNASSPDL
ncbi:hypothetical protein HDU96_006240 [Phlyctochytrium bullatum]|nr:hypothetical protein HDU96_006240 [Phlyctochytrium bullatum]